MSWKKEQVLKKLPKIKNPILIEGLPGIANVGKIAADFLVDELKGKLLYRFFSYSMPNTVFVNENNLVDLPKIEMYYVKGKRDLLFLIGDVQPIDEVSSYEFSELLLDILIDFGGKEVITLGGIGLPNEPEEINVYCTGNCKDTIKKFKNKTKLKDKLYGVVGPIVGVSGLLLGLGERRDVKAIALLAETLGHPMFLGIKGAKELLKILKKNLDLKVDLTEFNKEIKELEQGLKKATELQLTQKKVNEINYIG